MLKLLPLTLLLAAGLAQANDLVRQAPTDGYYPLLGELVDDERVYIVQMAEPPALAYRGGTGGMPATRPAEGQGFDAADPDVRRYGRYLQNKHDSTLRAVGAYRDKIYSYRYAFNGFAARMTAVQAQKLRARRGVLRVWEDRVRYLATNNSAGFLGLLDGATGLRTARGLSGENVVIAVIDSGIAPEHPSFKDRFPPKKPKLCRGTFGEETLLGIWLCTKFRRKEERLVYQAPADWNGACEAGDTDADKFSATDCNNKLIGARFYIDGFLERQVLDANEFISPRDADGHGTHIATTAGGNEVRAVIGGQSLARIAGMAPRARIAVYKACWLEPGQTRGSCSTADLQRAIEDAVADGVHIINYSVGSSDLSISDPDDLALLTASDAGVLGVVAAGNDGPTEGTILSPAAAPWVLSVGVSSRTGTKFERGLRVTNPGNREGNYVVREGLFTQPLSQSGEIAGELVLVDDGIVGIRPLANGDAETGTVDDGCEDLGNADAVNGKIAFVRRGFCDFTVKLQRVEAAGAVAAVVFNNDGTLVAMGGAPPGTVGIPGVMIGQADGQLLLDSLNAGDVVELSLLPNLVINEPAEGNRLAGQSARGPNLAAPDILKPDVVAPGVDILAGQTPDVANGIRGEFYQYLTGTSMSVPHVAGLAALLKQQHPDWSPAALRSALMTTARQDVTLDDGTTPAGPFDFGAGHVDPNKAADPGLIYEADKEDYDAFNCGSGIPRLTPAECDALVATGFSTDPSDLNLPSIAVADLAGQRVVTRRVTNVGEEMAQFEATVVSPDGLDITVSPSVLNLAPGETSVYQLDLRTNGATLNEWRFGAISWGDGQRQVRSPIAVRPVSFSAPEAVAGTGMDGNLAFELEFGYDGAYTARVTGLQRATIGPCTESQNGQIVPVPCVVGDDPLNNYVFQEFANQLPPSVRRFEVTVPAGSVFLRVALYNEDTDGDDDLDLYLYRPAGQDETGNNLFIEYPPSTNGDSNELIELESDVNQDFIPAGKYIVDVHGFDTDPAGGSGAVFKLSVWVLEAGDDQDNLTVSAPTAAVLGATAPVNVQWQNLGSGRYLGGIEHRDNSGPLKPFTAIDVFVPVPDPAP
ncbi:MAG: S8 family serine peptidase [Chromatiales bacterium]|nr:MAG: S8 family serine peptidase [Chromatiales bacterium]